MMRKTDAAILLIKNALKAGIKADYVLMDTWFTTEPMIAEILETGIDAIGMVKQLKQRYTYNGKQYKLPELKKFVSFEGARNIFGSLECPSWGVVKNYFKTIQTFREFRNYLN